MCPQGPALLGVPTHAGISQCGVVHYVCVCVFVCVPGEPVWVASVQCTEEEEQGHSGDISKTVETVVASYRPEGDNAEASGPSKLCSPDGTTAPCHSTVYPRYTVMCGWDSKRQVSHCWAKYLIAHSLNFLFRTYPLCIWLYIHSYSPIKDGTIIYCVWVTCTCMYARSYTYLWCALI